MNESSMDNGFFGWIRELGLQRGEDHWVGGVCCGMAQRFGISPILVRGIFVALCFVAGVGLLLYGLAWAFMPGQDGRIHFQEAVRGHWSSGMTGALIFFIVGAVSSPTAFGWWDGGFWTLLVILGVGFLLFARRGRFTGAARAYDTGHSDPGFEAPGQRSAAAPQYPEASNHETGHENRQQGTSSDTEPFSADAAPTAPMSAGILRNTAAAPKNGVPSAEAANDGPTGEPVGDEPGETPAPGTWHQTHDRIVDSSTLPASSAEAASTGKTRIPLSGTGRPLDPFTEEKTMPLPPIDSSASPGPFRASGNPAGARAGSGPGAGAPPPGSAGFTREPAPGPSKAPRPPRHKSIPGYAATIVLGLAVLSFALVTGLEKLGWLALPANAVAVGLAVALVIIALGVIGAAVKNRTGGALVGFGIAALVLALIWGGGSLREGGPYGSFMGISTTDSGTTTNVFHSGEMDLRSYSTITTDTTVQIDNVFSSMKLTVPDNIPVAIDSENPFSSMQIGGSETQVREGITYLNPDASGPTLSLRLEGAFNSIEINAAKAEVAP